MNTQIKVSEHQIQKQIIDYLQYRENMGHLYFIRNNSFSGKIQRRDGSQGFVKNNKKGSADIFLCVKGKWFSIEVKREKGKQSKEQKEDQQKVEKVGGKYFVVHSLEELLKSIDLRQELEYPITNVLSGLRLS